MPYSERDTLFFAGGGQQGGREGGAKKQSQVMRILCHEEIHQV